MIRHGLTDEQWGRIEHLIPGKPGDPGRTGKNNRLFVDAIMRMARTGTPWRDLSPSFGKWNSVWKRFRRWARAGCGKSIIIDGTIIRGAPA
jgi:transposase